MKQLSSAFALACVLVTMVAAQSAQDPQPPTFRSSVDLVPVDVNIVDRTGRPVTGLEAKDFVLTIDGRPRRIVSAEYVPAGDGPKTAPAPTYYSSNTAAAGGRLIMLVVDEGNIGAGRGKLALDAASRFVAQLGPADRVGLVAIPGSGPQVDFTSNHAVVQALLPRLVGQAGSVTPRRIGLAEAVDVQRGDQFAMQQIFDRECTGLRNALEIQECTQQLTTEAGTIYQAARERTRNSLVALRHLIERLASTPSPKTIVLVSEGIVLENDLAEISWLGPAAARGQIVLYVLQLDTPQSDAAETRTSPTRGQDVALGEEGLGLIAGMARGSVFRVVSNPDAAFTRLGLEISGYYLVSFAPEADDRDGKTHKIKVDVPHRSGIEIRSRTQFTVETVRAGTDESILADALRAPLLATDIGLKVSTYTLRDRGTGKLRVVIAADIDRSVTSPGRIALAFTLLDARGRLVSSQLDPDVTSAVRGPAKTQTYVGSVLADAPGVHTLKLAVVDAAGKRGSVEHTFRAEMTSVGQLRATDLMIAENAGSVAGLVPAVAGDFTSDTLHGYLELYADVEEPLAAASVVFEVAESAEGRTIDSAPGRIQAPAPDAPGRRTVEGAVSIGLLPPGEYVARAVIALGGRHAATLTRPFRISSLAPPANTAVGNTRPIAGARPAIPFTSRIDAFERSAVLSPQVVTFFLDRMNVGASGAAAAPAIAEAKAGRFDAAVEAVKAVGNDQLAAVFLNGLALLARGQLDAAAGKFRDSLRIDSEFFPAAFYLGSCYAAGGQDREAVGAWQTSLVTESDAPFVYTLLGDALLRLRDADQAVNILQEAAALWPENEQVQLRLGTAQAMADHPVEALKTLEPYLSRHPDDVERLFVALRLLYEAKASGRPVTSAEEDRALFSRYAAAYAAASGPQRAVVDQWKKFMQR
jgi:VWFA-related protein